MLVLGSASVWWWAGLSDSSRPGYAGKRKCIKQCRPRRNRITQACSSGRICVKVLAFQIPREYYRSTHQQKTCTDQQPQVWHTSALRQPLRPSTVLQ